jgi:hypothetical protein
MKSVYLLALCLLASCGTSSPSRIQTGSDPSGAILSHNMIVVTAAMDSSIQFFDAPSLSLVSTISLGLTKEGKSPNPWAIAPSPDGRFAAVALYDDHAVALIDLSTRTLVSTTPLAQADLRHPVALRFVGDDLYVLFSNLLGFGALGEPTRYDAGVIARFAVQGQDWVLTGSAPLPCLNPSDLGGDQQGSLIVACSGSLFYSDKKVFTLHDGAALVHLDPQTLAVKSSIKLQSFSPSQLLTLNDGVLLSSGTRRQLMFVPSTATSERDAQVIALNAEAPDESGYMAALVKWSDDIALVSDFYRDELVAINLSTRTLNPIPFTKPIKVQPTPIARGPKVVLLKNGAASMDLFVLMNLSAEIIPVKVSNVGE